MKNKIVIYLSVAFLVLVVVGGSWFIWPRTPRLDRYQALFLQGQYSTCRADLTSFLAEDPQWLGARELLLRVELADEKPLAAVPHFLYLLEAGENLANQERMLVSLLIIDTDSGLKAADLIREALIRKPGFLPFVRLLARVELAGNRMSSALEQMIILAEGDEPNDELDASLIRIALSPGNSQQIAVCLEMLTEVSSQQPEWEWPAQLALELALAAGDHDLTAQALTLLPEHWSDKRGLDKLIRRAWQILLTANRLDSLFPLLRQLDSEYGKEMAEQLTKIPATEIERLLKLFPDSPLLLLQRGVSLALGGNYKQGLNLVLAAEADHPDPVFAAQEKFSILLHHIPAPLEGKHLRGLENLQLFELALTWQRQQPSAVNILRNRLAEDPKWLRQADLLRQLNNPPPSPMPYLTFELPAVGYYRALPSPDGRKLAILSIDPEGRHTSWLIADINSGTVSPTETVEGPCQAYWSPNSRRLLLVNRSSSSQTWVINTSTFSPFSANIPGQPLGWLDNDSIITLQDQTVLALNAGTTALTAVVKDQIDGYPLLTFGGEVWLVRETSDRVSVDTGSKVHHLPKEYIVVSPLPDNLGVGGYHRDQQGITHMAWIFESDPLTPLILPGLTPLWNHSAGPGLVWAVLELPGQPDRLATLNLETLTPSLLGITGGQVTAANGLAVTITGRTVAVYLVPGRTQ